MKLEDAIKFMDHRFCYACGNQGIYMIDEELLKSAMTKKEKDLLYTSKRFCPECGEWFGTQCYTRSNPLSIEGSFGTGKLSAIFQKEHRTPYENMEMMIEGYIMGKYEKDKKSLKLKEIEKIS